MGETSCQGWGTLNYYYFLDLCQGNIIYFSGLHHLSPGRSLFMPRGWILSARLLQKRNSFFAISGICGFKPSSKYISFLSPLSKLSGKHRPGALIAVFLSLVVSLGLNPEASVGSGL